MARDDHAIAVGITAYPGPSRPSPGRWGRLAAKLSAAGLDAGED